MDVWRAVLGLEGAVNPYVPSIVGVVLFLLTLLALRRGWFAQLSDIFNPNSAAEVPRRQFIAFHLHVPLNWLINVAVSFGAWAFMLAVVILINHVQAASGSPVPPAAARPALVRFFAGDSPVGQWRFLRLVLSTWLVLSLPVFIGIASLYTTRRLYREQPHRVDLHGMAMLGVCSLLGLLNLSAAEWLLGLYTHIGWALSLLPWVPVGVLIVTLFSPWPWTEGGKDILNACKGSPLPPVLPTLDFIEEPPTPPKSGATDAEFTHKAHYLPGHEGPLVLFCISGGGSRAALFTAGILSRMWWQNAEGYALRQEGFGPLRPWLMEEASAPGEETENTHSGGSEGVGTSSAPFFPGRLLLQRLDGVSSVSGGSLAASYLIASLHRSMHDPAMRCSAIDPACALQQRHAALRAFFDPAQEETPEASRPPILWYNKRCKPASLRYFFHSLNASTAPLPCSPPRDRRETPQEFRAREVRQKQVETNPYINAMQQDHLAACLSGLFLPWIGRGPGIEQFWQERYQWYRPSAGSPFSRQPLCLADFYAMERTGHLPALILNGTLTRTGTRLAITNLAASEFQELYKYGPQVDGRDLGEGDAVAMGVGKGRRHACPAAQAKRRYDPLPAQINTLNELDARWRIPLATATRASANFPVGFPLMRFVRRRSEDTDPDTSVIHYKGGPDVLEISDGGLIDNTGVDSVMALLRANRDAIKRRGVLIFQIDSGELPRNPAADSFHFLLHHLAEAKNALWRANLNLQSTLHSLCLDELAEMMEDTIYPVKGSLPDTKDYTLGFAGKRFAFFQVRAGELAKEHVMTSWHLDAIQRARLYDETRRPQLGEAILKAAEWLAIQEADVQSNGRIL